MHDTGVRRHDHKPPLRATVPHRSIDRYKKENEHQFQFQAGPKNSDLNHIGEWSNLPLPILAASPTLEFSNQVVETRNTTLSAAALEKVEGHELRPKKKSRRDSPSTSQTNLVRLQSLEGTAATEGNSQTKTSLLACPFYKKDGQKYHDCLKYELKRVKDVKQHICRKHTKDEFSCPSCSNGFSTKEAQDRHESRCQGDLEPRPGSTSAWQRRELNVTNIRGCSTEEQWFSTWDTVFPGQPRPKSCYLGNNLQEMMTQIRDLWDRKRGQIIGHVLNDGNKMMDSPSLLDSAMQTVFNQFESEMATPNLETKTQKKLLVTATPQQQGKETDMMTRTSEYQGHATEMEQNIQEGWQHVSYLDPLAFDKEKFLNEDWVFDFLPSSPNKGLA
ncbi:hypothetical protein B0J13DRAFT_157315 [Dactylonectria estremocensis]|uniref:C2H2-type domain-containing protein n=1 Tax=Dactylonectria estremocensis TaxID=1079267 RepID=A0A9P9IIV3_9HYPO|nr:hypothetical protein B0J13DRAFT_157315 [Dactylonectria estremocensis]